MYEKRFLIPFFVFGGMNTNDVSITNFGQRNRRLVLFTFMTGYRFFVSLHDCNLDIKDGNSFVYWKHKNYYTEASYDVAPSKYGAVVDQTFGIEIGIWLGISLLT